MFTFNKCFQGHQASQNYSWASLVAQMAKKKKISACNAGDLGLTPGLGRSPGRGHDDKFHYPCLENPHFERNQVGCSPWGCK